MPDYIALQLVIEGTIKPDNVKRAEGAEKHSTFIGLW